MYVIPFIISVIYTEYTYFMFICMWYIWMDHMFRDIYAYMKIYDLFHLYVCVFVCMHTFTPINVHTRIHSKHMHTHRSTSGHRSRWGIQIYKHIYRDKRPLDHIVAKEARRGEACENFGGDGADVASAHNANGLAADVKALQSVDRKVVLAHTVVGFRDLANLFLLLLGYLWVQAGYLWFLWILKLCCFDVRSVCTCMQLLLLSRARAYTVKYIVHACS